jgi:hypothetical protein
VSSSLRLRRHKSILCLLAAILSLVSWFAGAQAASAGGPTSVLLASPRNGRVAALYHTDAGYERLVAALEAYEVNTGSTTRPSSITNDFGNEIRLTWLIHDMTIWRIDRVHITAEDGVWIETVVQTDGSDLLEQPAKWHRAVDANALTAVLGKAGLLSKGAAPPSGPEPMTAATSTAESPGTTPAPSSTWLAAATGIGGLLVGAAGSIVMLRRASRRTAGETNNDRVVLTG